MTAAGPHTIWAFNAGNTAAAWRRSGSTWQRFAVPGAVTSAAATSATDVWAAAGRRVLRWTGTTWTTNHMFAQDVGQITVLSRSDIWVFGEQEFPSAAAPGHRVPEPDAHGDLRAVPRRHLGRRQRQPGGRGRPAGDPAR